MEYKEDTVNGTKRWFLHDKLHREDGPAVECDNGNKLWYLHGKCHREDGPAVELANGDKWWYLHGLRHREDGPAIECVNGHVEWSLHGEKLSEQEFLKRTSKPTCEGKVVEVDGKKYRLTAI